ncbi:MAG: hypothetical protein ABI450_03400, partial [Rhizomicrobium sp.]
MPGLILPFQHCLLRAGPKRSGRPQIEQRYDVRTLNIGRRADQIVKRERQLVDLRDRKRCNRLRQA